MIERAPVERFLCAIKQARAIAAIIAGQRGEKGREKPAIDREDRESQTGIRETAWHRDEAGREEEGDEGTDGALAASIQQAPATLNSAGQTRRDPESSIWDEGESEEYRIRGAKKVYTRVCDR